MPATPLLTNRFQSALEFAFRLHAAQVRKNKGVPYFAHLMSVTALVLEAGGDEDEAIAALLHDAAEDQGGKETLADIKERFGSRVARLVQSCTDAYQIPKPPWKERKRAFLKRLESASPSVLRIVTADKLHNLRTIYRDLKTAPDNQTFWDIFTGGKEGTLWYYRSLEAIFQSRETNFYREEYSDVLRKVEALARKEPS